MIRMPFPMCSRVRLVAHPNPPRVQVPEEPRGINHPGAMWNCNGAEGER